MQGNLKKFKISARIKISKPRKFRVQKEEQITRYMTNEFFYLAEL